jgi:hypothetical protein
MQQKDAKSQKVNKNLDTGHGLSATLLELHHLESRSVTYLPLRWLPLLSLYWA